MSAIWLLSSRGRPREAQATIDACQEAGMTSTGVLYVDETVDEYKRIRLPKNWLVHYEPEWRSLQGSMSWCFETFPGATQYGWLADDTRPRTRGWDKQIEQATGDWNLAYCKDLWYSENPGELEQLERGFNLSSGLCWGGALVRAAGWWALPGVKQAGIDTAWTEIVRPLQLHRYLPDVTVEHLNWRTGKRKMDAVDDWTRDGDNYIDRDIVARNEWCWSLAYRSLMWRLDQTIPGGDARHAAVVAAMRQSLIDQLWREGKLPAARLTAILEGRVDAFIFDDLRAYSDERPA